MPYRSHHVRTARSRLHVAMQMWFPPVKSGSGRESPLGPVMTACVPWLVRSRRRARRPLGHELDVVQGLLELLEELIDLRLAVRGPDEQRAERVLVDALVEQPEHDVRDLFAIAVHAGAVVDDALFGPLQAVEV